MKDFIWSIPIIIIPAIIFLCPFAIAFLTGNFWYIFLFSVTWFPAIIVGKFFVYLYDNV